MKLQNLFTPCYCSNGKNDNSEIVSQETGLDRIKRMYGKSNLGFVSPELNYLIKSGYYACSISAVVGAIISANQAKEDFMRRNTATQFESQHLGRRRLADTISLAVIKGGLKYAAKYGSFSTLYMLSTMTAANYNNKITIWEHIASGVECQLSEQVGTNPSSDKWTDNLRDVPVYTKTFTLYPGLGLAAPVTAAVIGGLFRFNYGLKGMAAAGSAGAVLGAIAGGILLFSMWLTDTDFEKYRYWQSMTYLETRKHKFEASQRDFLKRIE